VRGVAVLGTVAFLVAFAVSGHRGLSARAYVLFLGALGLLLLVRRLRETRAAAGPSSIAEALRQRPPAPQRPPELERLERAVALGATHAGDFHARLRPVLREIAAALLARRGVALDRDSGRARELLGDDAWELVRPDAARPERPFEPGVSAATLRSAVARLEELAA
jgi:hypothetical protein